jgi:hypothetical protein
VPAIRVERAPLSLMDAMFFSIPCCKYRQKYRQLIAGLLKGCSRLPNCCVALSARLPTLLAGRCDLFDKRRHMMNEWAAFLAKPEAKSPTVVNIQSKRA